MAALKWYKRDPDAALGGMMMLTLEERGAYNTVLDLIYSHADNLIDDDYFLAGWMRCDLRVWRRIKQRLIDLKKIVAEEGAIRNFRATSEIDEALGRAASVSELNHIKGIKSGIARRNNNNLGEPTVEPKTNTTTTTTRIEDKEPKGSLSDSPKSDAPKPTKVPYPQGFEEFWRAYPTDRLMSKKKAGTAWSRLSPEDRKAAVQAIPGFQSHCASDATYRPVHAVRFLSERRFEGFLNGSGHKNGAVNSHGGPDEAKMIRLLEIGRDRKVWQIEKFGPMPNQPGCRVPSHLLKPGDGEGWTEWKASR